MAAKDTTTTAPAAATPATPAPVADAPKKAPSFLQRLLGGILENTYQGVGPLDVANKKLMVERLGVKLVLIKGISQDLGSDAAKAFLAEPGIDPILGPFAGQVVDLVNGNTHDVAGAVLALIGGAN